MRLSLVLATGVVGAAIIAAACGTPLGSAFDDPAPPNPDASAPFGGGDFGDKQLDAGAVAPPPSAIGVDIQPDSLRIEPADAVLTVAAGATVAQPYKVFGKLVGNVAEEDLTKRVVFYVPDNFLVGGFGAEGKPTFQSRLPVGKDDPPQRGGKLTVRAIAATTVKDKTVSVETSLTVKLTDKRYSDKFDPPLPASPETKFAGPAFPARNPQLAYPNDKTMLPPNLRKLDVHWWPGTDNTLFEVSFESDLSKIVYYSRCGGGPGYVTGACAFELDGTGYGQLADSNRGAGPVKVRVRGADDSGVAHGDSQEFTIEFAENRVDGGLYYWTVTSPNEAIMRFDFGAPDFVAEQYIKRGTNGIPDRCPGCHAMSRQGTKLVASMGGQWDGRLVYINNLERPKDDPGWLTVAPDTDNGGWNRIQFASFNPDGSKFVAVYGDDARNGGLPKPFDLDIRKLWFHDGNTGLRESSKTLPFKPNHPEWAPDGESIAVTRVDDETTTTQRPKRTSIEILRKIGNDFLDPEPLVPALEDHARYNPSFVPDSSFLYFSESICPGDWSSDACDGDADTSAKTWVVKPTPGSTPRLLDNAAKGGVADNGATDLGDTFPRSAPFQTEHRGGKLFWFTVASRRKVGLRAVKGAQHLWMFAVDPAKVLAGEDGSYTGFYLPLQSFEQSNHIGQWTERIVATEQAPPQPPVKNPPPPKPPPVDPK